MDHYYIYCLHNEDLPEYYVGHTKDLKDRMHCHKYDANSRSSNRKVYQYINNNGGINNFKMEVLDEIYCDLQEAKKLERYYTELLGATLNFEVPGRTKKEYRQDNKEKISKQNKKYKQDNKEKIKKYYQDNKEEFKDYYQDNKEKIIERIKKYYQNNKQEILEKQGIKFTCICGSTTTHHRQTRHFRTQKHINFIRENIGY